MKLNGLLNLLDWYHEKDDTHIICISKSIDEYSYIKAVCLLLIIKCSVVLCTPALLNTQYMLVMPGVMMKTVKISATKT